MLEPTEAREAVLKAVALSGRGSARASEIVRVVAPNPGPMTLEGTNTYVVDGYVIDPGPDDAEHLERVREAAGGEIAGVLLTHGHSDHSAGVEALGADVLWGRPTRESEMEAMRRALEAGSVEASGDFLPDTGTTRHPSARSARSPSSRRPATPPTTSASCSATSASAAT